ncbi:hypothetical protein PSPO01_00373 [Paraphaeosphaeria sporulosa]
MRPRVCSPARWSVDWADLLRTTSSKRISGYAFSYQISPTQLVSLREARCHWCSISRFAPHLGSAAVDPETPLSVPFVVSPGCVVVKQTQLPRCANSGLGEGTRRIEIDHGREALDREGHRDLRRVVDLNIRVAPAKLVAIAVWWR